MGPCGSGRTLALASYHVGDLCVDGSSSEKCLRSDGTCSNYNKSRSRLLCLHYAVYCLC